MFVAALLLTACTSTPRSSSDTARTPPPSWRDKAGTARWMSRNIDWGVIATKSHTLGGVPFGNVNSFVDMGDGHLYFYVSPWDTSMQDVAADSHVSFTISEAMSGCVALSP